MSKFVSKFLCTLLTLTLAISCVACLAETVERTYYDYESKNSKKHYVYLETWEYTVDEDGETISGHPVYEDDWTEDHIFDDGECIFCGYKKKSSSTSDDTTTTTTTSETTTTTASATFTAASGVVMIAGTPAAAALKTVMAALPANTQVTLTGVDASVANALINAINDVSTTVPELLAILANFPQQTVDGKLCYVVTLSYTDAAGKPVVENYAFNSADATLVKVF